MTSTPPQPQAKTKFTLRGAQETLIVTLYSRYHDSLQPTPILNDKWAGHVLEQLDYDFAKLGVNLNNTGYLALRSRVFDRWTAEFLDAHTESGVTVLHLACGLDSRALRLQEYLSRAGGKVRWVDVDFPDVVELRRKLLPSPDGDYQLVGASVNEEEWLRQIPTDRPTVVVFEGLSMYLSPEQGRSLVERLTAHFGANSGQLLFDCLGWIAISLQRWIKPIQKTGSTFGWAIDDPKELEKWHEGLKLKDDVLTCERPGTEELPFLGRAQMWVMARLPAFRYVARDLRYEF